MFVEISSDAAVVREAADLKSLSVRVHPGADLAPALGDLGTPDPAGEHVWLDIAAFKAAAAATLPAAEQAEWAKGFDGMIAYATSKGWTNAAGAADTPATAVRAHIELG
jgi:cytochrome c556